jgi:hypothetical protein
MPKRKMSWVLIAWTVLMVVWLIAGVGGAAEECTQQATQLEEDEAPDREVIVQIAARSSK